jgi:16S rRNA (uracil1498-N3)-methyltransferase
MHGLRLGQRLKPALAEAKAVHLYIGPEGGFTDEEVELADSLGAVTLGLGPRILRAETAAIAACAAVQYELGAL